MNFWAAVHDNLPPAKDRPAQGGVDPSTLETGTQFELNGHAMHVVEDGDGYRLLKDGDDYPVTPVDALAGEKIPVDKGTMKAGEPPAFEGNFTDGLEDPQAKPSDHEPTMAQAATAPASQSSPSASQASPSEPKALPSSMKSDLFGRSFIDGSGVGAQAGMFHEPAAYEAPQSERLGSRNVNDPKNTAQMFPEKPQGTRYSIGSGKGEFPKPASEINLTGRELGDNLDFKELRKRAYRYAKDTFLGRTVTPKATARRSTSRPRGSASR